MQKNLIIYLLQSIRKELNALRNLWSTRYQENDSITSWKNSLQEKETLTHLKFSIKIIYESTQ